MATKNKNKSNVEAKTKEEVKPKAIVQKKIEKEVIEELDDESTVEEVENLENKEEFVEVSLEDRVYNIEKKTNAIFVMIIITMIISLVSFIVVISKNTSIKSNNSSSNTSNNTQTEQADESGYSTASFNKIKAQDIESVSKGKTAVIWIGRQTCGYCALYAPIIESVSKEYGFTANYLDLYSIIDENTGSLADQDGYNILINLGAAKNCKSYVYDNDGKEIACADVLDERFGATPMTLFVKDNKLVGAFSGYTQEEQLSQLVEEFGFSK